MNKCDCCGKFGELEEVTITIKKHKACDINGAFGVVESPVNIASQWTSNTKQPDAVTYTATATNPAAPYVNAELEKMIIK